MKGAREYASLFKTGQYGKLYFISGSHARGSTFRILVLPEGVAASTISDACFNSGSVEVYGMTGGHRGWTETYGWLHDGKWQDDFEKMVNNAIELKAKNKAKNIESKNEVEAKRKAKKLEALSRY